MLCKPKNPACGICPVKENCSAFLNNAINSLPVKLKTVKIRERYFNYFLITDQITLLMNKRNEKDIWANMYDLPLIETSAMLTPEGLSALPEVRKFFGENMVIGQVFEIKKHILTHQRLYVRFIKLNTGPVKLKVEWFNTTIINLKNIAMPKSYFCIFKRFF